VVIGILIALQINNANEVRKTEERTKQLLVKVQKELLINIKNSNKKISYFRSVDSIIYKVLNKKVTYDDYKSNIKYAYLPLGLPTIDYIIDDDFKNFIESKNELSMEQDSIVVILKKLYGQDKNGLNITSSDAAEGVEDFVYELVHEKEWFSDLELLGEITDEAIDYFLNDPFYLNILSRYNTKWKSLLYFTLNFRNNALLLYEKISEDLNLKKDTSIVKNVKDYEHYIGTYSDSNGFRIIIKEEKKELIGYGYHIKQQDTISYGKDKVYPDSKTYFNYNLSGFGQLNFDENNEVTGFVLSTGDERTEFKKVK